MRRQVLEARAMHADSGDRGRLDQRAVVGQRTHGGHLASTLRQHARDAPEPAAHVHHATRLAGHVGDQQPRVGRLRLGQQASLARKIEPVSPVQVAEHVARNEVEREPQVQIGQRRHQAPASVPRAGRGAQPRCVSTGAREARRWVDRSARPGGYLCLPCGPAVRRCVARRTPIALPRRGVVRRCVRLPPVARLLGGR